MRKMVVLALLVGVVSCASMDPGPVRDTLQDHWIGRTAKAKRGKTG